MAKILNLINVQKTLADKRIAIFSPQDLQRIFGVSSPAATFFVYRNAKKGFLVRLKKSRRGSLYAFTDKLPDPYAIANRLYEPSYISLDSALAFHGIIPETIYSISSVTTQTTRQFQVASISYDYCRIKKEVFTGYKPISHQNHTIWMAEPEKALADYIYFVNLGKRSLQYERMDLKAISLQKLKRYLKLYQREKMFAIMEKLYANFRKS